MKVKVIIPAGGSGKRFGGSEKKQFLKLQDDTILNHVVRLFDDMSEVDRIFVSLPFDDIDKQVENPDAFYQSSKVNYVIGGVTRASSVYQGFIHLGTCQDSDVVLVHDAARPLVSHTLIRQVIQATKEFGVAIPALPVTDTIKMVDEKNMVLQTVPRKNLRAMQTPQGFLYGKLKKAYCQIDYRDDKYTDEGMLMELMHEPIKIIAGDPENIKITAPTDLTIAETLFFRAANTDQQSV